MEEKQLFLSENCRFNLRNPNVKRPSPIYLVINILGKQYKIPSGVKVIPNHWNKKSCRALISAAISELDNRNNRLVNLKLIDLELQFNKFISYLCENLEEIENPIAAINKFFYMSKEKKTSNDLHVKPFLVKGMLKRQLKGSTFTIYKSVVDEFCDWLDKKHSNITISSLNKRVIEDYKIFLFRQKVIHKILDKEVFVENNTVHQKLNILKVVFSHCELEINGIDKILSSIKKGKQEENQVYLSDKEIYNIASLELCGKENDVRDLFLFQTSSGQRFSDIEKLCGIDLKDKIVGDSIQIIQKKTNKKVVFPLDEYAHTVLEKRNYILPKMASQKVNEILKVIAKKANINEKINCSEYRGGEVFNYEVEKYKLISTHCARRSFITNALKEGFQADVIKHVSGHSSTASFERYNRLSSEDAVDVILNKKNKGSQSAGNSPLSPSNASDGQTIVNGQNNPSHSNCDELKQVLAMLGTDPLKWVTLNDYEELFRLVVKEEIKLSELTNVEYHKVKQLFNDQSKTLEEKANQIKEWLKH